MGTEDRRYKPDYVKIDAGSTAKLEEVKSLEKHYGYEFSCNLPIGGDGFCVNEIMRTKEWILWMFHPFSKEIGWKDSKYETRTDALKALIHDLTGKGYHAVAFDLEGMIDNIK